MAQTPLPWWATCVAVGKGRVGDVRKAARGRRCPGRDTHSTQPAGPRCGIHSLALMRPHPFMPCTTRLTATVFCRAGGKRAPAVPLGPQSAHRRCRRRESTRNRRGLETKISPHAHAPRPLPTRGMEGQRHSKKARRGGSEKIPPRCQIKRCRSALKCRTKVAKCASGVELSLYIV